MMNYRIIATGLLAASLCIGLPACKKSEPADGGATTAQSLLNTQMNDPKWAKSEKWRFRAAQTVLTTAATITAM